MMRGARWNGGGRRLEWIDGATIGSARGSDAGPRWQLWWYVYAVRTVGDLMEMNDWFAALVQAQTQTNVKFTGGVCVTIANGKAITS